MTGNRAAGIQIRQIRLLGILPQAGIPRRVVLYEAFQAVWLIEEIEQFKVQHEESEEAA